MDDDEVLLAIECECGRTHLISEDEVKTEEPSAWDSATVGSWGNEVAKIGLMFAAGMANMTEAASHYVIGVLQTKNEASPAQREEPRQRMGMLHED